MTPFEEFLTFIRSRKPAENLSTEKLREFLTVKPERMGLDFEARWKQLRVDAERILATRDEERRHRQNLGVSRASMWVTLIAALAAIASAWYAKSQADSAALSARASTSTTAQQPATQSVIPASAAALPAQTGSATQKSPVQSKP
jgi:hypothetical protein